MNNNSFNNNGINNSNMNLKSALDSNFSNNSGLVAPGSNLNKNLNNKPEFTSSDVRSFDINDSDRPNVINSAKVIQNINENTNTSASGGNVNKRFNNLNNSFNSSMSDEAKNNVLKEKFEINKFYIIMTIFIFIILAVGFYVIFLIIN